MTKTPRRKHNNPQPLPCDRPSRDRCITRHQRQFKNKLYRYSLAATAWLLRQNERKDICGFAACCPCPELRFPTACLIDISNLSCIADVSVPVASLNTTGDVVAYNKSCVTPCVCTADGGELDGSNTRLIVGKSTPRSRVPVNHKTVRLLFP
jgi:hypothetical protein